MMNVLVILFFMLIPVNLLAAISFTNGKWESNFACSEQTQDNFNCDGLTSAGSWSCSDSGGSDKDLITSSASYSDGSGSLGFRHMIGDGQNNNGGGITASLPSAQKELWIRTYLRYESGTSWAGNTPYYQKLFYIHTGVQGTDAIAGFQPSGSGKFGVYAQGGQGNTYTSTKGWTNVYPTNVANGTWFVLEQYIKMDTVSGGSSQKNGVSRTWLNGELVGSSTSVNWSGGNATAANGWVNILIGSNQYQPNGGRCFGVDFDKIVIYNTTPPKVDASGNAFIGPEGWGGSVQVPSPSGLRVTQ